MGWKGDTTEVTGVNWEALLWVVEERCEGVGGQSWHPGLIWAGPPYAGLSWAS